MNTRPVGTPFIVRRAVPDGVAAALRRIIGEHAVMALEQDELRLAARSTIRRYKTPL